MPRIVVVLGLWFLISGCSASWVESEREPDVDLAGAKGIMLAADTQWRFRQRLERDFCRDLERISVPCSPMAALIEGRSPYKRELPDRDALLMVAGANKLDLVMVIYAEDSAISQNHVSGIRTMGEPDGVSNDFDGLVEITSADRIATTRTDQYRAVVYVEDREAPIWWANVSVRGRNATAGDDTMAYRLSSALIRQLRKDDVLD